MRVLATKYASRTDHVGLVVVVVVVVVVVAARVLH